MIRVLNMLPCMHLGGIETSVMNIYRHIERSKIQFDFAIFDDNNPNHYYEEEAKAMGARVFRLTRVSVNPIKALIHIKELLNLFKQNPDIKIVHIHRMGPGRLPLIIFLFMLCGIKIRIVHSRAAMPPKVRQKRATRFFLRTFSTHWLAVSNDAGRAFFGAKQWDRNTETQVFSGAREIDKFKFDHSKSQFTRETLGIDSNFVLAHVGRLTDEKNQAFLLEAFALALKENPQMVLLMVGGGPLAEDLSAKAATLGISDSVHFLGRRDDVADLLQAADLGLGTCWCGLHPVEKYMDATRKMFDLAKTVVPFCVIAVGVPAEPFGARGFYDEKKVRWL